MKLVGLNSGGPYKHNTSATMKQNHKGLSPLSSFFFESKAGGETAVEAAERIFSRPPSLTLWQSSQNYVQK